MYLMKKIDSETYIKDLEEVFRILPKKDKSTNVLDYDCIVCLKRSGFIIGAFLSNKGTCPLFTESEIESIPKNFNKILIVDDKIYSGKSIHKAVNKLFNLGKRTIETCAMYVEHQLQTKYYILKTNGIVKMWYEN